MVARVITMAIAMAAVAKKMIGMVVLQINFVPRAFLFDSIDDYDDHDHDNDDDDNIEGVKIASLERTTAMITKILFQSKIPHYSAYRKLNKYNVGQPCC